jgi:hypothetical protein
VRVVAAQLEVARAGIATVSFTVPLCFFSFFFTISNALEGGTGLGTASGALEACDPDRAGDAVRREDLCPRRGRS